MIRIIPSVATLALMNSNRTCRSIKSGRTLKKTYKMRPELLLLVVVVRLTLRNRKTAEMTMDKPEILLQRKNKRKCKKILTLKSISKRDLSNLKLRKRKMKRLN